MHRTHIFLAGLIAVAALVFSGLFGSISQGPPGLGLTHNLQLLDTSYVAVSAFVVAGAILSVGLGLALFAKSELGGRLRRSPLALLMWTMAGQSRVMYRAMRMFFMPHVHASRLQTLSALR